MRIDFIKVALLAIVAIAVAILPLGMSDTYQKQATVIVSVNPMTIIDVYPTYLNYQGDPGSIASATNASLNRGDSGTSYYITVTNLGSTNISSIEVYNELPTTNPWGQADPSLHKSGEFAWIANDSTSSDFKLISQRLFEATKPGYVSLPSGCNNPKFFIFRTWEGDWFIALCQGTSNYTDGTVYIANAPRNTTSPGTTDLSTATSFTLTSTGSYGYASIPSSHQYQGYYFIVNSDATEAYIAYWDSQVLSKAGLTPRYLFPGTLYPSQSYDLKLQVRIPYGVPAGNIGGTIYIKATSA